MKQLVTVLAAAFFISCGGNSGSSTQPYTEERTTVSADPVKVYEEPVGDSLNPTWKFKVELFEQKQSLKYHVKFQYKEVTGEKIFSYPNLGFMPKPELKKGPDPLSCIIGFYDADSTFMELRIVKVENDNLVYRHLKEYQVDAGQKK
jgi:hypothetical protein